MTGLSGVGKTTISKKLIKLIEKKFGKTIVINGDDLRKIFELKKYDIKSRKEYVLQYSRLCKFLSNQNINVIMSVVGLFHHIHKWNRKHLDNYIEIYIKSSIDKITRYDQRGIYKKKKVVGIDIIKQIPKKPHISIFNDFKKSKILCKKIFNEIINILKNMIIAEICAVSNYSKKYSMRKSMYDALSKKYKKFYFINCNFLIEKKKIKIDENLKKNKNIFFFHPKSYKELNKFLSSHKIFLINNLSYKFYHLMIHILLSKVNIFQIRIDNLGEMSSSFIENWKSVNLQKKNIFYLSKKIPLIIYKILLNINLIWPVDILYLARKDIKNKFEKKIYLIFF